MKRLAAPFLVALVLALGSLSDADAQTIPGTPVPPAVPVAPVTAGPDAGSSTWPCGAWAAYGRGAARSFDYSCPSAISSATAATLVPTWSFKTPRTVTASPAVAGNRVFVGDWSATMFALDATTGEELWRFASQTAPGTPFGPITASPAVGRSGGRDLVVFGSGPTMHALDAETGDEVWSTYVGSASDPTGHPPTEETEFESSPVIRDGIVYSGVDVHNRRTEVNFGVRGGLLAFDLATGRRLGTFDPEHDFVAAGSGERLSGCSSVWSSPTLDVGAGLAYFATGNCPHDLPPDTGWGRHIEAVSAVELDPSTWADPEAATRWTFTPEPLNRDDTDFGATPNLFVDGNGRTLLGIGKKNAVYYALDPATGDLVWSTKVTEPGNAGEDFAVGGFIGTTATGRGAVFGGTAIGFGPPYFHALDGRNGASLWSGAPVPTYAASAHVNGVVLSGALDSMLRAYDARDGRILWTAPLLGPISSGPAIVGDRVFIGSGTSSSDLCAKDAPGSEVCFAFFDTTLGQTGGVHAFHLAAPGQQAAIGGTGTGSTVVSDSYEGISTHDVGSLARSTLLRTTSDGLSDPRHVCVDDDGRRLVVTTDDGWGVYAIDGSGAARVGSLAPSASSSEPAGCAFADDRIVTVSSGSVDLHLVAPGGTPVGSCALDPDNGGRGVTFVGDGIVVAEDRLGSAGLFRYTGPRVAGTDGCATPVDREPVGDGSLAALAPSDVVGLGDGRLAVSSPGTRSIVEIESDDSLGRLIVNPASLGGEPAALALDVDGTIYYADRGVGSADGLGTIRRVRFDGDGDPLPPETIDAGLDAPAGVAVLTVAGARNRAGGAAGVGSVASAGGTTTPRLPATGGDFGLPLVVSASLVLAWILVGRAASRARGRRR